MILRTAWRLAVGRRGLVALAIICIAIGIGARTAVAGFVDAVEASLSREARAVLAADVEVSASRAITADEVAAIAAELPPGSRTLPSRALTAMAATDAAARLVELRAVSPGYPLAGTLRCEPAHTVLAADACLVAPDLLPLLGVAVGDQLRLGTATFRIAGVVRAEPGAGGGFFRLGPRAYVPLAALAQAGLAGDGVRTRHQLAILLPDATQAGEVAQRLRARLGLADDDGTPGAPSQAQLTVRSAQAAAAQGARAATLAADWLRLVALLALLMGAVGVAALARGLVAHQAESLALLRTLGATRARTVGIFAMQAMGLGVLGGLVGVVVGGVAGALIATASDLPPVPPSLLSGGIGVGLGVLAAVAATVLPALELARQPPLAVLRGEPPAGLPRRLTLAVAIALAVVLALFAAYEARSWIIGPAVVGGAVVVAGLLVLVARILLPVVGRLRPRAVALRVAVANLARVGRGTLPLVAALGLCAALASALLGLRASLDAELSPGRRADLPAWFAIDVQSDQREAFTAALAREGLRPNLRPLIRARLTHVDGAPAGAARGATRESERRAHFRNREQNLTWAAAPQAGETLVSGAWPVDDGQCAVEERWAERVGVGVGAELRFDIQGVAHNARITGLRAVDWWTLQPNFFIVLGPGGIIEAPQAWVGSISPGPADLSVRLARDFPNVSLVDISGAAVELRRVIDRIALAVAAVALVALVAALAVVAGTAAAAARARRGEAALLRCLGATRRTVALALAIEHLGAAVLAAGLGTALGLVGAFLLGRMILNLPPVVPWAHLALLIPVLALAAMLAALAAGRSAWRVPPLAVLRED